MKILTALGMCMSMFLSIPMPKFKWDDDLRKLSTACLPLVGLIIGAIWLGTAHLARAILPGFLAGALIAAAPFLLTGFIHLDGFMDTADALLSWRDRQEKLRILKDVHTGSFSVVMLALLMMFQFAACIEVERLFPLLLIPVLSRCGSALCVLRMKPLGHSEYASGQDTPKECVQLVLILAGIAVLALAVVSGWRGIMIALASVLGYGLAMRRCVKDLGGISGDLAGFSLTISELCALIALAVF